MGGVLNFIHILILLFLLINSCLSLSLNTNWHPESKLSFVDYCKNFNYPVEQHQINTKDGYILTYYRIQSQNSQSFVSNLSIVYLQHGFIDSSDTWIVNSDPTSKAPAFYFADQGYDVWLGNTRGNKHGRDHIIYNPDKDSEFWDFSWQEMAEFDLPAGFEYITQYTKQEKINYIGHSQGTLIMFAALSENNQIIKSRLNKFIALGPIVSLLHQKSVLFGLIASEKLTAFLKSLNINEVLSDNWFTSSIAVAACRIANFLCEGGLLVLSDMKPELDSLDRMDVIMGHYPSGTSLRDYNHFVQMTVNENFQKYDFRNETENLRRYGQKTPPIYNLTNIEIPLYLYVGKYDELADLEDFDGFLKKLNGTQNIQVNYIDGGHATFLWGKNMTFLDQIFEQLKEEI